SSLLSSQRTHPISMKPSQVNISFAFCVVPTLAGPDLGVFRGVPRLISVEIEAVLKFVNAAPIEFTSLGDRFTLPGSLRGVKPARPERSALHAIVMPIAGRSHSRTRQARTSCSVRLSVRQEISYAHSP
ncbi:hypothetical protein, partial [Saccharopolyspora montiporae]|uniref:hypothetical protein n=1 Tax=Saccharopolyspora montiporae TaxID=2781240 RepID=UPI001D1487E7